jgi:hypothetical protein
MRKLVPKSAIRRCRRAISRAAAKNLELRGFGLTSPAAVNHAEITAKTALQAIAGPAAVSALGRMLEGRLFVSAQTALHGVPAKIRDEAVKAAAVAALTGGGFPVGLVDAAMNGGEGDFPSDSLALGALDLVVDERLSRHPRDLVKAARRFPPGLRATAMSILSAGPELRELLEAAPVGVVMPGIIAKAAGLGDFAKKSNLPKLIVRALLPASTGPVGKRPISCARSWATGQNAGLLHAHALEQRRQTTLVGMAAAALDWAAKDEQEAVYRWCLLNAPTLIMGREGRMYQPLVIWFSDSLGAAHAVVSPSRRWTAKISLENALAAAEQHKADLKAYAEALKKQKQSELPNFGPEPSDPWPRSAEVDGFFIRRIATVEAMAATGCILCNCMRDAEHGHHDKLRKKTSAYYAILDRGTLTGAAELARGGDGSIHAVQARGPANTALPRRVDQLLRRFVSAAK